MRMKPLLIGLLSCAAIILKCVPAAAEPLAVFDTYNWVEHDWPRTLVTYQVEFQAGQVTQGEVKLLDADGTEHPFQLWRVEAHPDGSIARARLSFFAELPEGGRYRFELHPGKPREIADAAQINATPEHLMLDNGAVAVRLLPVGEKVLPEPKSMADVPGPFIGVRLLDGRWAGGSFFFGGGIPNVTRYSSRIVEQGPLFVDVQVHYELENDAYYQFNLRMLVDDPALRIDEQMDFQRVGNMWDWRGAFNFAGKDSWQPDAAYSLGYDPNISETDPRLDAAFAAHGFSRNFWAQMPALASTRLAYDKPVIKINDLVLSTRSLYGLHRNRPARLRP